VWEFTNKMKHTSDCRNFHPPSAALRLLTLGAIVTLLGWALPSARSEEPKKLTMSPDGGIQFGTKSIRTKKDYGAMIFTLDNDIQGGMGEVFNFGEDWISPPFFLNHHQEVVGNTSSFATTFRPSPRSNEELGSYKISLTLLEDGLVRVTAVAKVKDRSRLKTRFMTIDLPPFLTFSGKLTQGNKVSEFDASNSINWDADALKGAIVEFFPDDKATTFSLRPERCSEMTLINNSIRLKADKDDVLSFLVDFRTQPDADTGEVEIMPNGIDVWSGDLLRTPDYSTSRNLLLNPSFEAGFRHWGFRTFSDYALPLMYTDIFVIDDKVSHSGNKSLRLRAMKNPLPFSTFALPVIPDKAYTISFWAKASAGQTLGLYVDGRSGNSSPIEGFPTPTLNIPDTWTRYEVSFAAQHQFVSIYLRPAGNPNLDHHIWIDDVQFEQGKMTDFEAPPIMTQLLSSARGNFLEFGKAPDFSLVVHAPPNSKGTVSFSVQDFFFQNVLTSEHPFETNEKGLATIALKDFDAKISERQLRGIFEVTASVKVDGREKPFRDYHRFSVMNFLKNEHRNRHLFDITYAYSLQAGGPEMERFVEHERNMGFGSYSYDFLKFGNDLDLALDKERAELMEKYGLEPTGRLITTAIEGNGQISEMGGAMKISDVKDMIDPTPEQLAAVEEIIRVKAELRPWSPIWFFSAESNPGMMPLSGHLEAFSKFLIATSKGVKKGNPNAKVLIEGGPWNMDPNSGIKWVEEYIQTTKRLDPTVTFDGAAGHTYGNFPEPLDGNVEAFLEMLDRNGHADWPLYLNEGGCYCIMSIPQLGITPYVWNSGNYWYIGALSYAFGKAERISSAFSARAWLVALKYQSRVVCMNDFFTPNRYLDVDFTARAFNKIPNTLGRVLGNAYFYQDIKFLPYSRAYVFRQDADGAPIAALWGYKETVDRWKEQPTLVKFHFGDQQLTFIDLMENEVTFPKDEAGNTLIPMTPFPIFVKGQPGTQDALSQAIAAGTVADGDESDALGVSAYPEGDGTAMILLKNNLPRVLSAEATVTLNGVPSPDNLQLVALQEIARSLEIPGRPLRTDKVLEFDFALQVKDNTPTKIIGSYLLLNSGESRSVTMDGSAEDWKNIPAVSLGEGLSLKTFVDAGNLYFAIEATGTGVSPTMAFTGTGFYFDPFERVNDWTAAKNPKGDLGIYELKPDAGGVLAAYCHIVQGTQAGSSSSVLFQKEFQPRFEVKTGKTDAGVFVECRVPQVLLSPLQITPGSRLGLNISLPTKSGTITLAPIADFKNPFETGDLNLVMAIFGVVPQKQN